MRRFLITAILLCVCVCLLSCSDKPVLHEHTYSSWEIDTPPTCTEEGVLVRVCGCGDINKTSVAALSHAYDDGTVLIEASCVSEGVTMYKCRLCNETYNKIVSKTPHTTGDYYDILTEEYHAKTCITCQKETDKQSHVYIDGECVGCHRVIK